MSNSYKDKLYNFYKEYKRMPSYSEMMKVFGFKSKNAVFKLIDKLIGEGIVDKDSSGKLIPNKLFGEVRMLGVVEAGFPTIAEEDVMGDTLTLDEFLIGNKDATYMLKVKGDSMIEAGIQEGDMVLVERSNQAKIDQIVIAEVDGGFTMKYYKMKNGKPYLEPANSRLKPIYPEEELRIVAVVRAVIRKY